MWKYYTLWSIVASAPDNLISLGWFCLYCGLTLRQANRLCQNNKITITENDRGIKQVAVENLIEWFDYG
jgi:hypothetical protein